ncbi:MAG TPA: hypothetical protein VH142_00345 [Polyangiaceae bacterium]|nr:hypothetical protein [Polyangiaceae bacterium]
MTRAAARGGALAAAVLSRGRIDLAHEHVRTWLGATSQTEISERSGLGAELLIVEDGLTLAEFAKRKGVSIAKVRKALDGPLAAARIPAWHVSATEFAQRAGVSLREVERAALGELRAAVLANGRLDLSHPASLKFMASHPFADPDVPPLIDGAGFLMPALLGEDIDMDHPIARVFLARSWGRVPTDADIASIAASPE